MILEKSLKSCDTTYNFRVGVRFTPALPVPCIRCAPVDDHRCAPEFPVRFAARFSPARRAVGTYSARTLSPRRSACPIRSRRHLLAFSSGAAFSVLATACGASSSHVTTPNGTASVDSAPSPLLPLVLPQSLSLVVSVVLSRCRRQLWMAAAP